MRTDPKCYFCVFLLYSAINFCYSGVLEANFIEPAHDKQDFERSTLFMKLETRLKQMVMEYWYPSYAYCLSFFFFFYIHSSGDCDVLPDAYFSCNSDVCSFMLWCVSLFSSSCRLVKLFASSHKIHLPTDDSFVRHFILDKTSFQARYSTLRVHLDGRI